MTDFHSRARFFVGSFVLAGLLFAELPFAPRAHAGDFTRIYGFGDSLTDTGNLWTYFPSGQLPEYPTGRFSGGTNYVDTMVSLLGVPQTNYAVGGATTATDNYSFAGAPGFSQEWHNYVSSGGHFAATDIVTVTIGTNDALNYGIQRAFGNPAYPLSGIAAGAETSAAQAMDGISAFVTAGARTLVVQGAAFLFPTADNSAYVTDSSSFRTIYDNQLQAGLATEAAKGIHTVYLDPAVLVPEIEANPSAYGFADTAHVTTPCPSSCVGDSALQDQYFTYLGGVHPTSHGQTIIGDYLVNILLAPKTLGVAGDVGMAAVQTFSQNVLRRLDLAVKNSKPGLAPELLVGGFSFFGDFNETWGRSTVTSSQDAYKWNGAGGTIGLEYRASPDVFVGAAINYSTPTATLDGGAGKISSHTLQVAVFQSWELQHFFEQGLLAYGHDFFKNQRPGVVGLLTSKPDGNSGTAALKTGYLFGVGRAKIGPVISADYTNLQIGGYTESGDPALDLTLHRQTVQSLRGGAGIQLRVPSNLRLAKLESFISVMGENDFTDSHRTIFFDEAAAPLIVDSWDLATRSRHPYADFAGGFRMDTGEGVDFSLNAGATAGKAGGQEYSATAGVSIRL